MTFDRRTFLVSGLAAGLMTGGAARAATAFDPRPSGWRQFGITTRVSVPRDGAATQVWVPVPSVTEGGWMRAGESTWTTNADTAELETGPDGASFVHATWGPGAGPAELEVTSTAATQDRAVDLSAQASVAPLTAEERALYTASTDLIPTDGIVRDTAMRIVGNAGDDLEKARRIYDWIVVTTERDPETRGCGLGDVASMLTMGDLTGKCADLNALFVGLARAAGLPARDVYGLRVAPSQFGYKSLGAGSANVTKAQHCRADVYLDGIGWVPADPADVRKVMLEEQDAPLPLDAPKVQAARETLFGAWEGNWIAYNTAHDVVLPGAEGGPLPFLMYPAAEVDGTRLDELNPDGFRYEITAEELTS
ncbi:transglutaminase [Salipiger sp. IMCC34102]|uniref:transglutaminase-like domain-containing protein n=1 Tax=Salipiger sp. IMCC34102 TaxID=2510647 RepID=UPI00101BB232|nr:transglutaminase domain-containing protein [Salipiger sp. IMCC34102]RYH02407.1 transglutaminase [Salipiger sp. IMCC34102]